MKWVTRERPKTDRIACPWLIKNFIDPEAEFLYVPADQVLDVAEREGAHSYDAPDAEYTHRDGLCSFEVLVEEYKLDDPALAAAGADRARRRRRRRPRRDAAVARPARGRRGLPPARARRPPPARAVAARVRRALRLVQARGRRRREPRSRRFHPDPAGREGGFRPRRRLRWPAAGMYVAHTGADRVDVLDCAQRTFLRSLAGLPGVAGVLVDEEHDLLFTTDRAAARVSVFRCSDETLLGRVESGRTRTGSPTTGAGAACTPSTSASRSARTARPRSSTSTQLEVIAELALPGRPRWALYDEERDRVYANIRDPRRDRRHRLLARGDRSARSRCRAAGPHGLWLDAGRLFCAADGGALVVLDRDSGRSARESAAAGRPRRRHARPRPRGGLRCDRRPRRRLQLRHRQARAARNSRDRGGRAHDGLGPGRPLPVRLLPGEQRGGGIRGTKLRLVLGPPEHVAGVGS